MRSLNEALAQDDILVVPGVWDGMSARAAEQAGFRAIFSSGMAIAASLGMPDADVYTMTENLSAVRRIAEATALPLVADIDHGYGGPLNVIRTVQLFEAAGAGAVVIEDQATPKRCPICVDDPVALVSVAQGASRIAAACEARANRTTLVIARTDAQGAEAIQRAKAYAAAGADFIFPVSKTFTTIEEWEACHSECGLPLLACLTPSTWVERAFDKASMKRAGVRIALLPLQGLYAAIDAVRTVFGRLQSGEAPQSVSADYLPHDAFRQFIGFDEAMERERKFGG